MRDKLYQMSGTEVRNVIEEMTMLKSKGEELFRKEFKRIMQEEGKKRDKLKYAMIIWKGFEKEGFKFEELKWMISAIVWSDLKVEMHIDKKFLVNRRKNEDKAGVAKF